MPLSHQRLGVECIAHAEEFVRGVLDRDLEARRIGPQVRVYCLSAVLNRGYIEDFPAEALALERGDH